MRILINDIVQVAELGYRPNYMTPQLYETVTYDSPITLRFTKPYAINCIGLGNCGGAGFTVQAAGDYSYSYIFNTDKIVKRNGLYDILPLTLPLNDQTGLYEMSLILDAGAKVGRVATGWSRQMNTANQKEIGFKTTRKPLLSLSGAVLPSISGYAARVISLTVPYKITPEIYLDFEAAYETQQSQSFPMFMNFDESEARKFNPIGLERFYGYTKNSWMFQSSLPYFLYSLKMEFTEAF